MLTIPSPCTKVCKIHPKTELCLGCWRTLDEIRHWKNSSNLEKQHLLETLKMRSTSSSNQN